MSRISPLGDRFAPRYRGQSLQYPECDGFGQKVYRAIANAALQPIDLPLPKGEFSAKWVPPKARPVPRYGRSEESRPRTVAAPPCAQGPSS
jgi:hypothetical protein